MMDGVPIYSLMILIFKKIAFWFKHTNLFVKKYKANKNQNKIENISDYKEVVDVCDVEQQSDQNTTAIHNTNTW